MSWASTTAGGPFLFISGIMLRLNRLNCNEHKYQLHLTRKGSTRVYEQASAVSTRARQDDSAEPPLLQVVLLAETDARDGSLAMTRYMWLCETDVVVAGVFFREGPVKGTFGRLRNEEVRFLGEPLGAFTFEAQCAMLRTAAANREDLTLSDPGMLAMFLQLGIVRELFPAHCQACSSATVKPTQSFRDEYGLISVLCRDRTMLFRRGRGECEQCGKRVDLRIDDVLAAVPLAVSLAKRGNEDKLLKEPGKQTSGGRWPKLVTEDYAEDCLDSFKDHLCLQTVRRGLMRQQKTVVRTLARQLSAKWPKHHFKFGDFAWLLALVPSTDWIRDVVMQTHQQKAEPVVRNLERISAVHDGQVLRVDGNFKLTRHVKRCVRKTIIKRASGKTPAQAVKKWGPRRFVQAGKVIVNATGTTGFMLRRNRLANKEDSNSIRAVIRDVCQDRKFYSDSAKVLGEALHNDGLPVCVAIDADQAYKRGIRQELSQLFPAQTVPLADAGGGLTPQDCAVIDGMLRTIPESKCVIIGDAKHVSLGVQKHAKVRFKDCAPFKYDINEAVMRWTKPVATEVGVCIDTPLGYEWPQANLHAEEKQFMQALVANAKDLPRASVQTRSRVKAFLSQPWAQEHPAWLDMCMSVSPPRRTLQRLAARLHTGLHCTMEGHGWSHQAQFIKEAGHVDSYVRACSHRISYGK